MNELVASRVCWVLLVGMFVVVQMGAKQSAAGSDSDVKSLIAEGQFAEAEKLLRAQVGDPAAPVTSEPAIQLEILRRTRRDFPLTEAQVTAEIKKSIPDVTQADIDGWRKSGDLQSRVIDGAARYFRYSVSNLFRLNEEAKRRQTDAKAQKRYDLNAFLEKIVKLSESSDGPMVYPLKHNVRYEVRVHEGHPRLKPGAKVRAWLPFPQEYQQQRDVKFVRSDPPHGKIASKEAPQRTIYFEQTIENPQEAPRFAIELEFVTSAYCPKLDPAKVQPYDEGSELYREYTAERPPHVVFSPEVKQLAREIVGDETNPLKKALLVFHWISKNMPWCAEVEYSIIPNLSAKGIGARRGDCGVQGISFITLCRAAGVPARWQSGWQLKPGEVNMHDWAEFYVEPWGWVPADASWGVRDHSDPRVRDFLCGHLDPYRLIVNLDYGRELEPPKTSFRSEPSDFQRGEIEIDGHNLYYDEWDWKIDVDSKPVEGS